MASTPNIQDIIDREYEHGFYTEIEDDQIPKGLNEDVIRLISKKKDEPALHARLAAQGLPPLADDERAALAERAVPADRLPGHRLLLGAEVEEGRSEEPRRGRSRAAPHLREARHPAARAGDARRRGGGRGVRQRVGGDHVQGQAGRDGHHLLLLLRGGARASRAGAEVSRLGRALHRQLLCRAQLRRLQRRIVLLHPEGRALPDGAVDLLPHQRREHRTVRAHPDRRRRGQLRELPGRLHGADARREPVARRRRRAGRAQGRADQVLDRAELVSRRQGRQGRHLQLRHQARQLPRRPLEDLVDAGRDRLGDHLEVPERHPARRQLGGRVLLGRAHQQLPAGRYRHEDDPPRQEHTQHHRLQGHLRRARPEQLPRPGQGHEGRRPTPATTRSATRC